MFSLESYRNRHALYKTDAALQAAHAAAPWILTWDDHEIENNYAGSIPEEGSSPPGDFAVRSANAIRAYYEHQPLRALLGARQKGAAALPDDRLGDASRSSTCSTRGSTGPTSPAVTG